MEEVNEFAEELDTATADNLEKTSAAIKAIRTDLEMRVAELKDSDANIVKQALKREEVINKNLTNIS